LLSIPAIMPLADVSEDQVLTKIETGEWFWAFDVRGPKASRRSIRVLAACLKRDGGSSLSFTDVLKLLFPYRPGSVTAFHLARVLSTSPTHVHGLIKAA
jgi:hypothetical protein